MRGEKHFLQIMKVVEKDLRLPSSYTFVLRIMQNNAALVACVLLLIMWLQLFFYVS